MDRVHDGLDMGNPLAIERNLVSIDPNAAVPLEPDSPRSQMRIQAQARRIWAPDILIRGRNPALRAHHHDAATRYLEDFLIGEMGVRAGQRSGPSVRTDPWSRMPYSEQRALRRDSYRRASKAIGPGLEHIVTWTVLQITPSPDIPPTVEAWAKSQAPKPWGTERAVGVLIAALEILADHYGYGPAQSRHGKAAGWKSAGGSQQSQ